MGSDFRIETNPPATDESIAALEAALDMCLPDCLKVQLRKQDGFQVYQNHGFNVERWRSNRCLLATDEAHITSTMDDLGNTILDATQRLGELFLMFAEEEDENEGIEHNPHLFDNLICIAEKRDDPLYWEQFTYWMPTEADTTDVYCVEQPLAGAYPLGYSYPVRISEQLEEPKYTFDDFIERMSKLTHFLR